MTFLTAEQRNRLNQAGYRIIGSSAHSAIKICLWTKKALLDRGECYKFAFYGIPSWRCLQATVALPFCDNRCVFCWRNTDITYPKWVGDVDEPSEIIDEAIQAQRKLLNGFPGNPATNASRWSEAQHPCHVALSLAGENTLYEKLPELIKEIRRRGMTSFLVTNGKHPGALERLVEEKALPTQLYISLVACNEENYRKVCRPLAKGGWKTFNESLEFMAGLKGRTRSVLRMTLVKGLNLEAPGEYAKLISKSSADYVEVKSYMALGSSRIRLGIQAMPSHEEIKAFASKLALETSYLTSSEHIPSRVVLLCRDRNVERKRFIKFA